ncbi:MAG TPA: hypothetical protein VIG98_02710, partial [Bacillus sp. (in: firmicutes)]
LSLGKYIFSFASMKDLYSLTLIHVEIKRAQNIHSHYPIGLAFATTCKIAIKPICFTLIH